MKKLQPLEKRSLDFIRHHRLTSAGDHILIAVSGGPDSTALMHVFVSLRAILEIASITVIHFDHNLRGQASFEDMMFVESRASELGLPFMAGSEDVLSYKHERKSSLEMAARECRHRFFTEQLRHLGARVLALGHTADDQAEEIMLRLLRGTGPSGMVGMSPKGAGGIIRPILFATRQEILAYLNDIGAEFREDPSNLSSFCQRNALRNEVFPIFEKYFHPRISRTLSRHSQLAREEEDFWRIQAESTWPQICLEESTFSLTLGIGALLSLHPALQKRMLRFAVQKLKGNLLSTYEVHIESIRKLAEDCQCGKEIHLPGNVRVIKESGNILLMRRRDGSPVLQPSRDFKIIHGPGQHDFEASRLLLHLEEYPEVYSGAHLPPSADIAYLDADAIKWPLIVRYRQPGDWFRPLGLNGRRKLQDFFTDAKVPRSKRDRIPLLVDQEKICWIVGYRIDERLKITESTRAALVAEHKKLSGVRAEG